MCVFLFVQAEPNVGLQQLAQDNIPSLGIDHSSQSTLSKDKKAAISFSVYLNYLAMASSSISHRGFVEAVDGVP